MLLEETPNGLYCKPGDFYVDPWRPVDRAVITHAHSDHATWGSKHYLAADPNRFILRARLGDEASIELLPYGQTQTVNGVGITFYPAGHILGSAQVALEHRGQIVVVSGDYKLGHDPTAASFEPIQCHTFVTESTFGLPIYRWPSSQLVFEQVDQWWRKNQDEGRASMLLAYSLGKAQRLLSGIDPSIGPIFTHGAVEKLNEAYRATGVELPKTVHVSEATKDTQWNKSLIVAPPSAVGTPWARKFGPLSTGMASGWMQIRGTRRRRSIDRGFVLSDHVDWQDLLTSIAATEAQEVWVTHGYSAVVVRYLRERGVDARIVETQFRGEDLDDQSRESSGETTPSDGEVGGSFDD